jgi:hypothetical protein
MVAGDIHYPSGDTGVLLLLKPAMVGGEPADVQQYRSRSPAFPHESTGDQFYSEAQWESYRRLGEHASVTAFEAVVEPARHGTRRLPEWMATFARARREWQPKPDGYDARLSRFADRVAELDAVLRQPGSERLLAEVYKEVGELDRSGRTQTVAAAGSAGTASASGDGHGGADATSLPDGRAHAGADAVAGAISSGFRLAVAAIRAVGRDGPPAAPDAAPDEAELTHALYLMRRVLLLMVEVYETEDLEKNSRHPLYLGVMNWFARWAYAPSFRMWWPLLKALYPQPFTRFLEASFALPTVERATGPDGAVAVAVDEAGEGFAMSAWRRQRSREPGAGDHVVSFRLKMRYRERQDYSLQAAQVIARREGATAWWDARDFFVPPGLWGIGIGNAFLEKLADEKLGALGDDGTSPRWLAVCVRYGADDRKRGADELQLYRGAGFCEARVAGGELTFAGEPILRLPAEHAAPGEAVQWVVLDRGIQPVGSGSIAAAATEPASAGA